MSSVEKQQIGRLESTTSEDDKSFESSPSKKNSELEKGSDPEIASIGSKRSLSQRFFTWTLNDLLGFNPDYAKSLRGILNILHIVFSMFVVALAGSACHTSEATYAGFYCSKVDTFTFVIGCSAFIQSTIFFICCLLSRKADRRIHITSYEVVYYVTYAVFFLIAGLTITTTASSSKTSKGQYQMNLGAGVFDFCATVAYSSSAVWFLIYHKLYAKKLDDDETINRDAETSNGDAEVAKRDAELTP